MSTSTETAPARTMGVRFHESLAIAAGFDGYGRLHDFSQDNWLHINPDDYSILKPLLARLHVSTQDTYHVHDAAIKTNLPDMIAGYDGLITHIQMMKGIVDIYWQDESFRSLFPPGTTKEFVYVCADLHDLGRFCGMNAQIQLVSADLVSHELLKQMFPGYPQDAYLHDIAYITGAKALPDPENNIFIYFMKLIDTCGKKPPRHPRDLDEVDGTYDRWYKNQLLTGSLPITKIQPITADGYRTNDIKFTLVAAELIRDRFPSIDFDEAIESASRDR